MVLGDSFPPEYIRDRIKRSLVPGGVIKLSRRMDDGVIKEKRFVVLHVAEDVVTFVVNTNPTAFSIRNPALRRAQVLMEASSHAFMDHDSYVDCTQLRRYSAREVVDELTKNQNWILGSIAEALRVEIATALHLSSTIAPALAAQMCASLDVAPKQPDP